MDWQKLQDRVWDVLVNKGHVLLAAICQGAVIGFHFKTGRDVGVNVMNTIYAFYGFLAGHFGVSQKWPDKDGDGVPDAMEAHGALPTASAPAPAAPAAGTGTDGAKG
jgi:hypothetical protein